MSQGEKLIPNFDPQVIKELNLTVLRRFDPLVEEILFTASHVALYVLNAELKEWRRKDVDGALFVVKRNDHSRFQFIVMNRRGPDNLVEDLLGDFEYEVQVPYLLYQNAAKETHGVWFYNPDECQAAANLLGRILNAYSQVRPKSTASSSKRFSTYSQVRPKSTASSSKSNECVDLETVQTSVKEGRLELSTISSDPVSSLPDDSSMNLFRAALKNVQPQVPSVIFPWQFQDSMIIHHSAPSLVTSSTPSMPLLDMHEFSSNNSAINLVTPSLLALSSSSTASVIPAVSALPLHSSVTVQSLYETQLVQPSSQPSPSMTHTQVPEQGLIISRDNIQKALSKLVQNEQLIDLVYEELLKEL